MSEPTALAEQVGVPIDVDDERERAIDDTDTRTAEEIAAEFAAGELNESDFNQPQRQWVEGEAVKVDAPELPAVIEPPGPECELLLNQQQAESLLDDLTDGEWRQWGRPPTLRTSGRGWVMSAWSEHDLEQWVARHRRA